MKKIFTTSLLVGALLAGSTANAFTLNFDSSSFSTNNPATGASATATFGFEDIVGQDQVRINIDFANTTGSLDPFGAGATESNLVGIGFDLYVPNGGVVDGSFSSSAVVGSNVLDTLLTDNTAALSGGGVGTLTFDIGVADDGNFQAGPNRGLDQGESSFATFILNTTLNASELETAFYDGFSLYDPVPADGDELAWAARFKGVNAGSGSDKLYSGTITGGPGGPTTGVVPEPSTYAMFGTAFLILGFVGYRSRNKKG